MQKIISYIQHETTQTVKIQTGETTFELWEVPLEATNGICEFKRSSLTLDQFEALEPDTFLDLGVTTPFNQMRDAMDSIYSNLPTN